jgi:hypothetical protein
LLIVKRKEGKMGVVSVCTQFLSPQ